MGPECMILVLWIYTMTSLSQAFLKQSPIVVFDPAIESHQKYRHRMSPTDQHSSDSHNRIISSITHPPPKNHQKNVNLDTIIPAHLDEYDSLKLSAREKQRDNNQSNKSLLKKLVLGVPDIPDNPSPEVSPNDSVSERHPEKNVYIPPAFPGSPPNYSVINPVTNRVPVLKEQKYYNYLELNPSGVEEDKEDNPRVHGQIHGNGYEEVNPVVNPYIQQVNPVRRNLIKTDNTNVRNDENFGVEKGKKKLRKSRRRNKPEVRQELETREYREPSQPIYYGDHDGLGYKHVDSGDARQQINGIDLKMMNKYRKSSPGESGDHFEGKVRRQDDGGGQVHVEAAGSEKKEEHQPKEYSEKHEEGEGVEVHEDHHEAGGEDEEKGYDSHHEHEKGDKGHHDKEDHDKHYDEEEGKEEKHSDDSDYYKHYDSGEKKGKESEFEEEGKFNKGHSTKGNHVVHKKDEYEKLEEFYDESHEEDGHEEDGAYHHEYEKEHGGSEKSGHYDAGEEEEKHGKKGKHEEGHHYNEKKGHDHREGDDKHHKKEDKYGKKSGHKHGKKWSYKE